MQPDSRPFTRRRFVGASLAVSTLAAAAVRALPVTSGDSFAAARRPFGLVVDRTLAVAAPFGDRMAARGGPPLLTMAYDPAPVWMNVIEPRLRLCPVAIGGLTTGATLFCLEYLARDYRLTAAYRLDGGARPDRRWAEQVAALLAAPEDAGDGPGPVSAWGRVRAGSPMSGADGPLLDLADLSGRRARSVFAWLLVPRT